MKKNNVVLKDALDDTEKKLDDVELSVNRGESQVKRLSKQIEELQETANVSQEGEECKDPELAFSEVSGRTFSGIVNRDHVSEANFSSRNVGESLSRVVFGSLVVNSSSVHVERSNPISEKPAPVPVSTLQENPLCFSDSSKLKLFKRQQTATQNLAGRNPLQSEERNRGSTDSSAREYCRGIAKQNGQYLSKAYRRVQSWTRRLGRAELRAEDVVLPAVPFTRQLYLCFLIKRER